jgi:spore maturation protein CgeB
MNETFAHSQVTLNRQIEAAEGSANNMRLFEATGVGAMLVTDDGKNLSELFRRAEEVVSYANEDDAVGALRRFVENKDERVANRRGGPGADAQRAHLRASDPGACRAP